MMHSRAKGVGLVVRALTAEVEPIRSEHGGAAAENAPSSPQTLATSWVYA